MPAAAAAPIIAAGIGASGSIAGSAISAHAVGNVKNTPVPAPVPLFPGAQANYLQQLGVTGGGGLGPTSLSSLNQLAQTGSPTDVGPAWQALVESQQRFAKQGRANILEQFAGSGLAYSSPLMDKLVDYESQLGKDYGSILANYTFQAQEAARGRQLSAAGLGAGLFEEAGMAFRPSSVTTVGGPSTLGTAFSAGGNALQMLAFMKMLYPGSGSPTPTSFPAPTIPPTGPFPPINPDLTSPINFPMIGPGYQWAAINVPQNFRTGPAGIGFD